MPFSWLNLGSAKTELAARLNDNQFVSPAEAGLYLITALRMFNALTGYFSADAQAKGLYVTMAGTR